MEDPKLFEAKLMSLYSVSREVAKVSLNVIIPIITGYPHKHLKCAGQKKTRAVTTNGETNILEIQSFYVGLEKSTDIAFISRI